MKKWIFLFSICIFHLNAVPFYQTPSPEHVYEWLQGQKIDLSADKDRPFAISVATTFIAQIIKSHPEYVEQFIQDFPQFSPLNKTIFSLAFKSAEIVDAGISENESSFIRPLSALDRMEFKSTHDFDLMLVSFLATGDVVFLKQPMAFLNFDPELLFYVYEWNNREAITKLLEELTGKTELPDEVEFLNTILSWPESKQQRFKLGLAAWWCLAFVVEEDPTAEEKISQLCKSNPRLNYQGTLDKLLN